MRRDEEREDEDEDDSRMRTRRDSCLALGSSIPCLCPRAPAAGSKHRALLLSLSSLPLRPVFAIVP